MSGFTGGRNRFLMWVHVFLMLMYFAAVGFITSIQADADAFLAIAGIFFLPIALHTFGAIGAYKGKAWGRRFSKIVGWLLVFGFPIGTIFGIMILSQIGDKWEASV